MKTKHITFLATTLLIGIASWSLYFLLVDLSKTLLVKLGVINEMYQNTVIVVVVLILLVLLGKNFNKTLNNIIKG